jgi:hypothetical protein
MAYLVVIVLFAAVVAFSGLGKIRRDPRIVHVVQEVVGVPLKYFSLLAACGLAGGLGLVLGIWWPAMGVAASIDRKRQRLPSSRCIESAQTHRARVCSLLTRPSDTTLRLRVRNNFRIARPMAKGIQCRRVISGGKT